MNYVGWVLVVIFVGGGGDAVTSIPKHSQDACMKAGKAIQDNYKPNSNSLPPSKWFCVQPWNGETMLP